MQDTSNQTGSGIRGTLLINSQPDLNLLLALIFLTTSVPNLIADEYSTLPNSHYASTRTRLASEPGLLNQSTEYSIPLEVNWTLTLKNCT